ncbi:dynein axonemal assembly factor 3 homolog [Episyrphus balteatus]|uniref:dynein axonemal assembly factor 3 homolog n=1 Tax=Episyrphus balteatus TaxID=286459 RepID=UPI002484EA4A|nr:dynein axonemal assembly factor 3 homolog [Episyrphus balteatus]
MFWGLSESLDFVQEYQNNNLENTKESLNFLLYGSCDPRHIIETAAKSYKHNIKINFYVIDGCVEIIARNIALIAIAIENCECLSLLQKTHLFMDIYGNSLLRPSSFQYLASKANTLLKICTDEDIRKQLAPIFDIDSLKYRERDGLENAFNFWLPKEATQFNIEKSWEMRNRQLLKTRYDYRDGAFDWDLQMCLKDRGAKQLCPQEYKSWRNTGIAFTFPEYEQCQANKTLAAGLVRNGRTYLHRGYVGDIQVGPFCAFGLTSREKSMLKSAHGENDYRSTDVTERNLLELFHEIQNKTPYVHDKNISRKYGNIILQAGTSFTGYDSEAIKMADYNKPLLPLPNLKVYFLSMEEVFGIQNKTNWIGFFDIVFVAQNYFRFLKSSFVDILRENGLIYFETNLYSICRKEILAEFEDKIKNFAKSASLVNVTNFNINVKHSILKYKTNKQ